MKTIDLEDEGEKHLKALVYGKPGTGKTGFGVTAPGALILLNEIQAKPNIRAHQQRIGRKVYAVLHMQSVQDYRNVLRALQGDKTKPFVVRADVAAEKIGDPPTSVVIFQCDEWPKSVVLDSLTEACELVAAEIREQSPQKIGKDGLPVDSERYWQVYFDRASKLIRAFRDVELNVLFLCLIDDKEVGEEGKKQRIVAPALVMRRLPSVVSASVNVVGITRRRLAADKSSVYGIVTYGPDYAETKPFPPLRNDEVMDFTSWCQRIAGIDDGSVVPDLDAPDGSPVDPKAATIPGAAPVVVAEKPAEAAKTKKAKAEKVEPKTEDKAAEPVVALAIIPNTEQAPVAATTEGQA